jgi:hypothetical protein
VAVTTELPPATVQDFRASCRGQVLFPGDEGSEVGRNVWNGMIDKGLGLIARCVGVADVVTAVDFAPEQDRRKPQRCDRGADWRARGAGESLVRPPIVDVGDR